MRNDLHEDLRRDWPDPPSERSTGLVFAGAAALIAMFHYDTAGVWLPGSVLALSFGLVSWLSRLVNPLAMFVLYGFVIAPFSLVMRLLRACDAELLGGTEVGTTHFNAQSILAGRTLHGFDPETALRLYGRAQEMVADAGHAKC